MLKSTPQWACVNFTGSRAKHPLQTNGVNVSVNDPNTYNTYENCKKAVKQGKFDGVSFVLTQQDPFFIIDVDTFKDKDKATPEAKKTALELIGDFKTTYQETSISGRGKHIICTVKGNPLKVLGRKKPDYGLEFYYAKRAIIITGKQTGYPNITDQTEKVEKWVNTLWKEPERPRYKPEPLYKHDQDVLNALLCHGAGSSLYFDETPLGYASNSEADLALFSYLYRVSGDIEQTKRLFMSSIRGQRKKCQRADYINGLARKVAL